MEPIRGAVIGAGGAIARLRHIPAFQEASRQGLAEIVAVCDPVPAALEVAGDQAGVRDRYLDYRQLLARADIDAITISTPNSLHEPITIAALETGKHVFCEKPLALSLAGARRMADAARSTGLINGVNHRYRWVPAMRYLHELVAGGDTGEVRQIFMHYFNALFVDPHTPIQWRNLRSERGGVLADIGSHLIDLAMWLLGPITRVRCDLRTFIPERPDHAGGMVRVDVDDAAFCQLEFASGAIGTCNVSALCLGHTNYQRIEVYGTKGAAIYEIDRPGDLGGDRLHVCFGETQHRVVGMAPAPVQPRHMATPIDPFLDFFRAIHEQRPAAVTFADAVRVQAVLDAAEASAAAGGVWMEPEAVD